MVQTLTSPGSFLCAFSWVFCFLQLIIHRKRVLNSKIVDTCRPLVQCHAAMLSVYTCRTSHIGTMNIFLNTEVSILWRYWDPSRDKASVLITELSFGWRSLIRGVPPYTIIMQDISNYYIVQLQIYYVWVWLTALFFVFSLCVFHTILRSARPATSILRIFVAATKFPGDEVSCDHRTKNQ